MPTQLQNDLTSLLPTLNTLPPDLLTLSTSLLAQSKSKAPTLKPQEEAGRTYACAHIACERLKLKHGFERVVPRPPVKPKVYARVFAYLEGVLTLGLRGTPETRRSDRMSAKSTDGRAKRTNAASPTVERVQRSTRSTQGGSAPHEAGAVVEGLCTAFDMPAAKAHIIAGVEAVLQIRGWEASSNATVEAAEDISPSLVRKRISQFEDLSSTRSSKRRRLSNRSTAPSPPAAAITPPTTVEAITPATLPALITALSLNTIFALRGQKITGEEYTAALTLAISTILALESAGIQQTEEELTRQIEDFLRAARAENWLDSAWFRGVQKAALGREMDGSSESALTLGTKIVGNGEDYVVDTAVVEETAQHEDSGDEQAEPAEEEVEMEGERGVVAIPRTPKKNKRAAKTPLRRKEKHAARPSGTNLPTLDNEDAAQIAAAEPSAISKPGSGLKVGLGTMFQDAVDWLSEERRAEYKIWEREVWERIGRMEGGGGVVVG